MSNVFYVEEMVNNLVSYARVTYKNKILSAGNTSKIYNKFRKLIGIAFNDHGLYKITSYIGR